MSAKNMLSYKGHNSKLFKTYQNISHLKCQPHLALLNVIHTLCILKQQNGVDNQYIKKEVSLVEC
jgi:hypothetical protein